MRIPLPQTLRNRSSDTGKDARAKNTVVEARGGTKRLVKRPALDQAFVALTGGGQLLTTTTTPDTEDPGEVVVITDDTLTNTLAAVVRSLYFSVQPSESGISAAIAPAVVVHALNAFGQIATGYTSNVTMQIASNPTGATLSGTLTVAAAAGVATFSNLLLDRSGEGFTLRATDTTGLRQPVSEAFDIPTGCVFTTEPVSTAPDTTMANVVVTIHDENGSADTNYTGNVTLTLFGTAGGVLSGTTTKAAVAGVATFNDLKIALEGIYDILAEAEEISTAYPPERQFSNTFAIANWILSAVEMNEPTQFGFESGAFGSLSPTTFDSKTIQTIQSGLTAVVLTPYTLFSFSTAEPADFFTSITINGTTLLAADATYSFGSWRWDNTYLVSGAGLFVVNIIK